MYGCYSGGYCNIIWRFPVLTTLTLTFEEPADFNVSDRTSRYFVQNRSIYFSVRAIIVCCGIEN